MDDDIWGEDPDWVKEDGENADKESGEIGDDDEVLGGAQHCLVLLDCSPSMFEPFLKGSDPEYPDDTISPVDWALSACETLVRDLLHTTVLHKTGKRDGFGIALYNTRYRTRVVEAKKEEHAMKQEKKDEKEENEEEEDEDSDDDYMNGPVASTVHEFVPLAPPGIATVTNIQEAEDSAIFGRRFDLQAEYGHPVVQGGTDEPMTTPTVSQICPLQLGLYEGSNIFRKAKCVKKSKPGEPDDKKQILIFTNDDDPCRSDADVLEVVKNTAKDVLENDIEIIIWHLPTKNQTKFRYNLFYDEIQAQAPAKQLEDQKQLLDHDVLLEGMRQVFKKTRRAFALPMLMPDWKENPDRPGIMLDWFRLVQFAKKPNKVTIHQQTGRLLKSIRQMLPEEGGDIVSKERLRNFVDFGGERVHMSYEDKVSIKKACNANQDYASLILLGFKDKDSIPFFHTLEHAYFIYPNDEIVEGSSVAFAQLHASMLRKNVIAIGELLTRVTATSRQVAIRPLKEEVDEETGETIRPAGMAVVTLPFADDIRALDPDIAVQALEQDGTNIASEELVKAAMEMVQDLSLDDKEVGVDFENGALARYWAYVEHVALEEPAHSDDDEYDTVVDEDEMLKKAGEQIQTLQSLLPEDAKPEKGRKRKIVPDDSGIDWETLYMEGNLSTVKVDDLKKKLRSVGEVVSGKKADLVLRVTKHLDKEFSAKQMKTES